jgi:hypothetical protein
MDVQSFELNTAAKKVEMADRLADWTIFIDPRGIMFYQFDQLRK